MGMEFFLVLEMWQRRVFGGVASAPRGAPPPRPSLFFVLVRFSPSQCGVLILQLQLLLMSRPILTKSGALRHPNTRNNVAVAVAVAAAVVVVVVMIIKNNNLTQFSRIGLRHYGNELSTAKWDCLGRQEVVQGRTCAVNTRLTVCGTFRDRGTACMHFNNIITDNSSADDSVAGLRKSK